MLLESAAKPSETAMPIADRGPRLRLATPEAEPYETITVDKLTPLIGAVIAGADLSRAPSARQLATWPSSSPARTAMAT